VFLYKMTHGQTDLCIASVNANRYRSELQDVIGMFVSTLPYRMQLDSYWSFDELVKHVRDKCLTNLSHSHYPLQHILADHHLNQSNASFLETMFDFITVSDTTDQLYFNNVHVKEEPLEQSYDVAKFDLSLDFFYNSSLSLEAAAAVVATGTDRLSCCFQCSHDLFDQTTVALVARRLELLFEQLFGSKHNDDLLTKSFTPINKLCLVLPEESEEMQARFFHRLENVDDKG
ncbi:unnamed protein product, partial [Adineta steineri]